MEEIKVKIYGLINITKKQYIITQTIVFSLLVILLILSLFYNTSEVIFGIKQTIICIVVVLEIIETLFVFKKFKEKEQNQKG